MLSPGTETPCKIFQQNFWDPKLSILGLWPFLLSLEKRYFKKKKYVVDKKDNIGKWFYKDEQNIYINEATQVDTENLREEKTNKIQDI